MADLEDQAGLGTFITGVLDRLGLTRPDRGLLDGSVVLAKLATAVLNAFLKLAVPGDHKIAFGSASLTWPGSTSSTALNVPHGLGATPAAVLALGNNTGGGTGGFYVTLSANPDATNIQLQGIALTSNSTTKTVYWLAIS